MSTTATKVHTFESAAVAWRKLRAEARLAQIKAEGRKRIERLGLAWDPSDDLPHDGELVGTAYLLGEGYDDPTYQAEWP